jgi:hypothetical protein
LTPSKALEAKLNREYGPGNALYDEMAQLALKGLEEGPAPQPSFRSLSDFRHPGWLCNVEVGGPKYRRARFRSPSEKLSWFSITCARSRTRSTR